MVIYFLLAFAFLVVLVLTAFDHIKSSSENVNRRRIFKRTLITITACLAAAMILFAFAEIVDLLYAAFNVIGILLIVGAVVFYFVQDYYFKKESENKQ